MNRRLRLSIPALALVATSIALPSSASVTLLGTPASQPGIPTKISNCRAVIDGNVFSPHVEFQDTANPVREYIVTFAFFDKTNRPITKFSVNETGPAQYPLPSGSDNFTCAIERLTLEDGSVLPQSGGGGGGSGTGIALGVLGGGAVIGLIAALGHNSSGGSSAPNPTATPTPSPSSSASATASSNPSATPTSVGTATPVPTATPSPLPTAMTTAIPTARPHISGPRGNGR